MERIMSTALEPLDLGPMPVGRAMKTVDELLVRAPLERIFDFSARVERWPAYLDHYRFVKFLEKRSDGGGLVEMSANRPFGAFKWPTWWTSVMSVRQPGSPRPPLIRYRHVRGITTGMDVEWQFEEVAEGTVVRIVHVWNGPGWPVIGPLAAQTLIGPVFVHGIASRTLAGLAHAAERKADDVNTPRYA
jgi:hypothetical protein